MAKEQDIFCIMGMINSKNLGYPQEMWFTELWLAAMGYYPASQQFSDWAVRAKSLRGTQVQFEQYVYILLSYCHCKDLWYGRWPD